MFLAVSLNYLEIKAPEICFVTQPSVAMLTFYIKNYYINIKMYMIPFCKNLPIRLTCSVKLESKKRWRK